MSRELHVRSHMSRIEFWRHLVEIIALCAAAVWALYVFAYQERIKPASAPADLQPSISVEHTALQGGREFVKVSIRLKNISDTPLSLGGMAVDTYGIRYLARTQDHVEKSVTGIEERSRTLEPADPTLLYAFLDMWKPFGSGRSAGLDPQQELLETFVFALPQHAFDVAKLNYMICWQRRGTQTWDVSIAHRRDGSIWINRAISDGRVAAGLVCRYQIRGEYYPI